MIHEMNHNEYWFIDSPKICHEDRDGIKHKVSRATGSGNPSCDRHFIRPKGLRNPMVTGRKLLREKTETNVKKDNPLELNGFVV